MLLSSPLQRIVTGLVAMALLGAPVLEFVAVPVPVSVVLMAAGLLLASRVAADLVADRKGGLGAGPLCRSCH